MPITVVSNVVTESAPVNMDRFARTGVIDERAFAICDQADPTKQIQFNPSGANTNTVLTLATASGEAGGTLTLPASGNTLATLQRAIQYSTPTTGQTVALATATPVSIIEPSGTLSALTVTLPATPTNGTTLSVTFTTAITTLTVTPGGADSIVNAPTSAAAGAVHSFIYRSTNTTWYKVI